MRCAAVSVTDMMSLTATFSSRPIPNAGASSTSRVARQDFASSFSSLPRTRSTFGSAANASGSICAAQPVTTMRASGRSRAIRRIVCCACRTASAVTAQVLTTTVSPRARGLRVAADDLGFVGVQPAAEGDDIDAHHAAPAVANSSGSKRPSYS